MIQTNCRHFNGYKPCVFQKPELDNCSEQCPKKDLIQSSILIIHLGALGAVVRSTALLERIQSRWPESLITWVTDKPADQLLANHPLIDRVLTTENSDLLKLSALKFDAAYVIDKSLQASGILSRTEAKRVFGFVADPFLGVLLPASSAAQELWEIGLSDQIKFFENKKSEIQLNCEALELSFDLPTPDYNLPLLSTETRAASARKKSWTLNPHQPVLGINTGCSSVIAHKKLSVRFQREIVRELLTQGWENIVLLGGREDGDRNQAIGFGLPVFQSAVDLGLRDGLTSVAATDLVLSGDSLGMHMAISQKKFVVAWFGPTCAQEIELYGRGLTVQSQAPCAPCWKRTCDKTDMCYDQVRLQDLISALAKGRQCWEQENKFSLSKPLF